MLFTIEKLPDEPIVFTVMGAEFSLVNSVESYAEEFFSVLDTCTEQVYAITDMTLVKFTATDVVQGANSAARQFQIFKHPKIIENVIFTHSKILKLAAQGFDSPIFGNIKMAAFDTREAALAYVRGKITAHHA
ncbi:MAG: hypothetical protein U0694_08685 [Anaerolineae bacterium]